MSKNPSKSLAAELDPFIAPFRIHDSRDFHLTAHKTSARGGLDKAAGEKMMALLPGVTMRELKGGVYKSMPDAVNTPYVINQVVASDKLSTDLVYAITKMMNEKAAEFRSLFAGAEEIDTKIALEGNKIPLHPGAEKYYREVGLIK